MEKSQLFDAVSYPKNNVHFFCDDLLKKYSLKDKIKNVVEIGGSTTVNAKELFGIKDYLNCDLIKNDKIPTLVCDCTKYIPLDRNTVDFVFSNDTFEHLANPFSAAEEIKRILRPGGIVFIGTLFSWRYHPVPEDYFRFSPHGLKALFPGFETLEANFCNSWRRNDIRGFWKSGKDSVPVDELGGWRENWKVYYLGRKV